MDFVIEGGHKLSGTTIVNASKNGAMGLMCAALLNKQPTILKNIPRIEEVNRIIEVMNSVGIQTEWIEAKTLKISPPEHIDMSTIDREAAVKTRTILMFMGALVHRTTAFEIPHSQGCKLGERTAAAHIYALKEMGIDIEVKTDRYVVTHNGLNTADFPMFEAGDTACENALLTAALIPGTTTIRFSSSNYMVQDVCLFLISAGVKIEGVGTSTLIIHGISEINQPLEFTNSEDPIEAMMFIAAAATTESELTIKRVPIDFLTLELYRLKLMGLKYDQSEVYLSYNNHTRLVDLHLYPSQFVALPEKIHALPYPGINMDNLPFFVPIAIKASGDTMIHDWSYENRAIYYMEMTKLGAEMILADPHRVYIKGTGKFKAAEVVAPPALRPAVIVLLGMLAAPGESILRNVYMINRGYEEIAERLNALGAKITIEKN
jgi:UDP-N-acetylglucosamine 1-carboxyvinyltransferase